MERWCYLLEELERISKWSKDRERRRRRWGVIKLGCTFGHQTLNLNRFFLYVQRVYFKREFLNSIGHARWHGNEHSYECLWSKVWSGCYIHVPLPWHSDLLLQPCVEYHSYAILMLMSCVTFALQYLLPKGRKNAKMISTLVYISCPYIGTEEYVKRTKYAYDSYTVHVWLQQEIYKQI